MPLLVLGAETPTCAAAGVLQTADISLPANNTAKTAVHTDAGKNPPSDHPLSEDTGAGPAKEQRCGSVCTLLQLYRFVCRFPLHNQETCDKPDEDI